MIALVALLCISQASPPGAPRTAQQQTTEEPASPATGGARRAQQTTEEPASPATGGARRAQQTTEEPASPATGGARRAQQTDVQAQLDKERAMAAQLAGREQTLLGRLADLERQIDLSSRALKAAQQRVRVASSRAEVAERRSQRAAAELERASSLAAPRLVARYELGRQGYLRYLLGARSVADLFRRKRLLDAVLQTDLQQLARLRDAADGARSARDELVRAQAELSAAAAAEAEKRSDLEARAAEQRTLLASVQQEKSLYDESVAELEEAAGDLSGRLGDFAKAGGNLAGPPFARLRGKLPFPVDSGTIEVRFGKAVDPRFGTVTLQRGIDVRCPEGTAVRAVAAGRVVHAGWFRGYGNLAIVDHGGGYFSLMAHLATLARAKGDLVRQGDAVGTVGDTGSLKGAYLYFELRDDQKPLDPEHWLQKPRRPSAAQLSARTR
jgi:septal ring factor EnvC (AmiA/AmiB activator)